MTRTIFSHMPFAATEKSYFVILHFYEVQLQYFIVYWIFWLLCVLWFLERERQGRRGEKKEVLLGESLQKQLGSSA